MSTFVAVVYVCNVNLLSCRCFGKINMGLVNKFHATLTVDNKIIMVI